MDAGVGVNEDALGSEALGAVAGNGVAVIEMPMLLAIELDLAAIVETGAVVALGWSTFRCPKASSGR